MATVSDTGSHGRRSGIRVHAGISATAAPAISAVRRVGPATGSGGCRSEIARRVARFAGAAQLGPERAQIRSRSAASGLGRIDHTQGPGDDGGVGDVLVALGADERTFAVAIVRGEEAVELRRCGPTRAGADRSPRTADRRTAMPMTRSWTRCTVSTARCACDAGPNVVAARKSAVRCSRPHGSVR